MTLKSQTAANSFIRDKMGRQGGAVEVSQCTIQFMPLADVQLVRAEKRNVIHIPGFPRRVLISKLYLIAPFSTRFSEIVNPRL